MKKGKLLSLLLAAVVGAGSLAMTARPLRPSCRRRQRKPRLL